MEFEEKQSFFGMVRGYSASATTLKIDYSFDDVPDPMIVNGSEQVSANFLDGFKFSVKPGHKLEDLLKNSLGWFIFSPRIVEILKCCQNPHSIQLLHLPKRVSSLDPR